MPKKRIIKKRVTKRKIAKKDEKPVSKNVSAMSKLEYEQSMMDPRFRAVMSGFGVGQNPGINQTMNQKVEDLNKRLGENNELKKAMIIAADKADLEKKNAKMKQQIKILETQNKTDLALEEAKFKNKLLEKETETLKLKSEHDKEMKEKEIAFKELQYNASVEQVDLKQKLETQRRKIQENELLMKSREEKEALLHQQLIEQIKQNTNEIIEPLKQSIKETARKTDIENIEFTAAEQVADASYNKAKAELNANLQSQLQPIQASIAKINRDTNFEKLLSEHDEKLAQATYDHNKAQMMSEFQKTITPIQKETEELKNAVHLNSEIMKKDQELIKAQNDNAMQKFESTVNPLIERLNAQTKNLEDNSRRLEEQSNYIKQFKAAQEKLFTETLRAEFEPRMNAMNEKISELKTSTDLSNIQHNQKIQFGKAEAELLKAQFEAANLPIINSLQEQKTKMENMMKINGDINGMSQKIEGLKTDIALLKQQTDPETMRQHSEEVLEAQRKLIPLEAHKRLATKVHGINLRYENEVSDFVSLGAQALGDEFKIEEIGTSKLNEKLAEKERKLQEERAIIIHQTTVIKRQIEMEKNLENAKVERAALKAQLESFDTEHSPEYNAAILAKAKIQNQLEAETKSLKASREQLESLKSTNDEEYLAAVTHTSNFYDNNPLFHAASNDLFGENGPPDPRKVPDVLGRMQQIYDANKLAIQELDPQYLVNDEPFQQKLAAFDQAMKERNFDAFKIREQKRLKLDMLTTDLEQAREEKIETQKRLKQGATFIDLVYQNSTVPLRRAHEGEDQQYSYYQSSNPGAPSNEETVYRDVHPNHRIQVTGDRLNEWQGKAGIVIPEYIEYANNITVPDSAASSATPSAISSPVKNPQISENV